MTTEMMDRPTIQRLPEFAGILKDDSRYAIGEPHTASDRLNGWFDQLVIQSGWNAAPSMLLSLCIVSGTLVGGLTFVFQENVLIAAAGGLLGAVLPVLGLLIAKSRRQAEMIKQMPEMIEKLVRAARSGHSLENCFQLAAEETPNPLGTELKLCSRKMQLGIDLNAALRELPQQTGLVSLNLFVMALAVHHQSGGDLVGVLERLSSTIRDRLLFLGRLKAATAASRATAVLMIALPPAILGFFVAREPDYLTDLWASTWGRGMTVTAVVLQIIGSCWVLHILKTTRRS